MKTTQNDILTKDNLQIISDFLEQADLLKNSYFWTAPGRASDRRRLEEKYLFDQVFEHNGHFYTLGIDVNCSCHHVYVSKEIYKDGERTTQTTLNTLLRKHYEAAEQYSETA